MLDLGRSLFGASSLIVAEIWHRIEGTVAAEDPNDKQKHLLWALVFLKVYGTSEEVHCAIVGWPHVQTFQKYSWYFVEKFFDLQNDVIIWKNRFDGQPDLENILYDCMITVDCLDCSCSEPFPASKNKFSKKFNGPGLKYEVGICIKTGHGGFPLIPTFSITCRGGARYLVIAQNSLKELNRKLSHHHHKRECIESKLHGYQFV
jgi:hypothetical protein